MAETDVEEEEQHHKIKEIDDEEKLRIASPVDYSFKEMTELQGKINKSQTVTFGYLVATPTTYTRTLQYVNQI